MSLTSTLLNGAVKGILRTVCRIDDAQLERVPEHGPLIVVVNHVNFLELPILYTHLLPRPITAFVKSENWEKFTTRSLFNLWGGIPIRRGEPDLTALRKGIDALKKGSILAISPEGTRSGHGILQACHPGIVLVALHSGAPILPIVYYGAENYRRDLARLKRVEFNIAVGRPFHLIPGRERVTRALRRQMLDEIMFRVAALLPPQYRGVYSNLEAATQEHLAFSTG